MKKIAAALAVSAVSVTAAQAGGLDRSGQGLGNLFEKGRHIEFSLGHISPSLSGNDVAVFGGRPTGNVANSYNQLSFSYKYDINQNLSFALIVDQPFGADTTYGTTSVALGGTTATAKSTAVTGLLRYKLENGLSVHGGLSAQRASADITLRGAAFGGLSGYNAKLAGDYGLGYVVGVAYEKPEIALRVALTYRSAIKHGFNTVETINGTPIAAPSITNSKTPQSINLDFQSGVAKDTLVFGQIRWVDWSSFRVAPVGFMTATGGILPGLVDLEDTTTYTLGVGRKFTDAWSGALSVSYEKGGNKLVSPLAPTTGKLGVTLAGVYTSGNMKITTGINYTKLGDATPYTSVKTATNARANFTGNKAVGIGVKVGFSF